MPRRGEGGRRCSGDRSAGSARASGRCMPRRALLLAPLCRACPVPSALARSILPPTLGRTPPTPEDGPRARALFASKAGAAPAPAAPHCTVDVLHNRCNKTALSCRPLGPCQLGCVALPAGQQPDSRGLGQWRQTPQGASIPARLSQQARLSAGEASIYARGGFCYASLRQVHKQVL